jgi:hypothetical protein
MPVSVLYKDLKKRISTLKKHFLAFQPSDSHLPINQDKLRAFKLLAHAEIESYIENTVLNVWTECEAEWRSNRKVIAPLAFLILFSTSKFEANEHQLERNERISKILTSFKNLIGNNNGIKRKNILSLVIPLGVDYSRIDETWLATIDSYGGSRGLVAHNTFSVQHQLDRNDELSDLSLVLKGISKMDIILQKIRLSRRKPF